MLFLYFGKVIGFLLLIFTGIGVVWYTYDGLRGSNAGYIFLMVSVVSFVVIAYMMYHKRVMAKSHIIIVIPITLVLGILCVVTSPILLHYTDAIHWIWLVEAVYDPDVGVLFLLFAREIVLHDQSGITAYAGFDSYNLGNATVMQDRSARAIMLHVPESLQSSLSSGMVIGIDYGTIGAADPHTIPNIMPPTIVITTPFK